MIRKALVCTITVVCLLCPQVKANQAKQANSVAKANLTKLAKQTKPNKPVNLTKLVKEASLACPANRKIENVSDVKATIVKHSLELGIDPALALSIAKSESGFRHEARSHQGAVGVFQLMPSTAKKLGVNPYYLSDNIKGGLMYYKHLYDMFGSTELALAAYNAGPTAVRKYKKVPPIGETQRFVSSIMSEYNRQKTCPDPILRNRTIAHNKKHSVPVARHQACPQPLLAKSKAPVMVKTVHSVQPKQIHKRVPPIPIELPAQGVI